MMVRKTFTAEFVGTFEGYYDGEPWNGFYTPYFEIGAARRMCALTNTSLPKRIHIMTEHGRKALYAVGAHEWGWLLVGRWW